ncbi:hypothetical protein [Herbiconiux sp. L3-i23]|uniref:hypothetical protein n=1 Tax=Herbiconiux sp. L3-i23 TaxID=2905871 RepID=UPI002067D8F8|nr:hypothetical protein [Herbiconiux sp. L3-i23]BDI22129.1 hypothetical protein L3i23_09050 [Herbiconiux sp. L3-i23]
MTPQHRSPVLSELQYDQTRQYHPFARQVRDGEWLVQPPTSKAPIGVVRSQYRADGALEFAVYSWIAGSASTVPFDETHPTLFHAVSWLRWRLGARIS